MRTRAAVEGLTPGYFALVMATGIISNAFFLEGRRGLSDGLLAVNLAVYAWLCVATGVRAARFLAALWADLASPRLVFSFFTIVAATDTARAATMSSAPTSTIRRPSAEWECPLSVRCAWVVSVTCRE